MKQARAHVRTYNHARPAPCAFKQLYYLLHMPDFCCAVRDNTSPRRSSRSLGLCTHTTQLLMLKYYLYLVNQIHQSKVPTIRPHTGKGEATFQHHHTQRTANPASRSDAGLGECERVATKLDCETRLFSTTFISVIYA